jgi:CTP:molybdopterin cytidylyltransferase MocA
MGRPKPLLPFGDAPMVVRVVESIQWAGEICPIVVVTGHERDAVAAALGGRDVVEVFNSRYEMGEMLSSVQAGVRAVAGRCDAVVMALGDHPAVEGVTVRSLVSAWRRTNAPVVSPVYAGRAGHPVVIAARLFDEILDLPESDSLKTLIRRHEHETLKLHVNDPGVVADVDTPEQYQQALRAWARVDAARQHNLNAVEA